MESYQRWRRLHSDYGGQIMRQPKWTKQYLFSIEIQGDKWSHAKEYRAALNFLQRTIIKFRETQSCYISSPVRKVYLHAHDRHCTTWSRRVAQGGHGKIYLCHSFGLDRETIVHELAHNVAGAHNDHNETWAKAYADIVKKTIAPTMRSFYLQHLKGYNSGKRVLKQLRKNKAQED